MGIHRYWWFPAAVLAVLLTQGAFAASNNGVWINAALYDGLHVILPEDASPMRKHAAELFFHCWNKLTPVPITMSPRNEGKINVWIGKERLTRDIFDVQRLDDLDPDGYAVRTYTPIPRYKEQGASRQLIIAGATDRGTLNGVYGFFHDVFGWRWLAPGMVYTPYAGYTINKMDTTVSPSFRYREMDARVVWAGAADCDDAHHFSQPYTPPPGDVLMELLPPESCFAAHPDWFALVDGARNAKGYCWTAPGLAEAAAAKLLAQEATGARRWLWTFASQPDAPVCACDACRAAAKDGACPDGPVFALASAVAAALETARPGEGYFAGVRPTAPPCAGAALDTRVTVVFSTRDCAACVPLAEAADAATLAFAGLLKAWWREGNPLLVEYAAANAVAPLLPLPNFAALQPDLRFFDQYDVMGVHALGAFEGKPVPGPFAEYRAFLLAELLWNPDERFPDLCEVFETMYYGAAAPEIRAYIALLTGKAGTATARDDAPWFDEECVTAGRAHFEAALAAELKPEERTRVERERAYFEYAAAHRFPGREGNWSEEQLKQVLSGVEK